MMAKTQEKIGELSRKTEEVLLLLLNENIALHERLDQEIHERKDETAELRNLLEKAISDLEQAQIREKMERQKAENRIKAALKEQSEAGNNMIENLKAQLEKEQAERINDDEDIRNYFEKENDERKKNLSDINDWILAENDKRMKEAENLRVRMEKEKQELRDFLEKDSKAMQEKLSREEDERLKNRAELSDKLKDQQEASENEIILLHKMMADENKKRENEIEELRLKLEQEKQELKAQIEHDKAELEEKQIKENMKAKNELNKKSSSLKGEIDENMNDTTRQINELAAMLKSQKNNSDAGLEDLLKIMNAQNHELRDALALPLSVYFDAYRDEDYLLGGEEYLTFSGCHANLGSAMDTKSGVFSAPIAGAYMFILHVCTHDMKKALMSLQRNGCEVASFYDQNHESNHKNSMVGQSVILDLEKNDRVQVYMYTFTGLQDKKSNHLTHFVGVLLRPKHFMEDHLTNGN